MRTIIFSYAISNAICTGVMALLWWQNRHRLSGLGTWLLGFVLQFMGFALTGLRGALPDLVSIVAGNTILVAGFIFLYEGLARFVRQRVSQRHNYIFLAIFAIVHAYFTLVQPNLAARVINISVGILVVCSQCVWLAWRRARIDTPSMTHWVGLIAAVYCLFSLIRIVLIVAVPPGNDFFRESNPYEPWVLITYQMLFVAVAFVLALLVNRHLFLDFQTQSGALRQSEEKFARAFHSSPDAILISRLSDGRIVEVNEGFCRLSGYSRQEALASSTLVLNLWADPQDCAKCVTLLRGNQRIRDHEYDFIARSGQRLNCLYSGEVIELNDEMCILSVVRDITAHKRAEESLRESETRARAILNAIPDLVFRLSRQGVFLDYKAEDADLYTRPENIIGKPARDILPLELAELIGRQAHASLETGEMQAFEYQLSISGRGARDYEARMLASSADEVIVFVRDITERKRTEEIIRLRLRLLEFAAHHSLDELMQKALDEIGELAHSPIGFYHFVEEDQKTLSLQAWSTRTLQEFCKAEGKDLHYSIDQAGVWVECVHQRKPVIHNDYAALPASRRKGMPPGHAEVKRELVVPTMRQGRIVSILGVGNKPTEYDEKDVELVAYVADIVWTIVERKRAEEQLQNNQRQLEAQNLELRKLSLAIEQSGSTIVITDTEGGIQYANPRFEETSGYTLREALGQNPRILKSGEQGADFYRDLWDTIANGQIWRGELRNKRKDGKLYWESATIAPVQDAVGQITNYIAVKEDITERIQAQESLRRYAEQLEAQNAELDAFAHTVAHDLKNPLSILIGASHLLVIELADTPNERARESAELMVKSSFKMNVIIDELLLLSSVRKMDQVELSLLDMAASVAGAQERLAVKIAEQQAKIVLPTTWPGAVGYAPWIEEVWANYLDNAIKYGGRPPRVELGWESERRKDEGERVSALLKDSSFILHPSSIKFWVRDNGDGLSEQDQARLFAPFERLSQVHVKGHGLGLSIVQRIVEKLGGTVGVESDGLPGRGSTFFFTLPQANEMD